MSANETDCVICEGMGLVRAREAGQASHFVDCDHCDGTGVVERPPAAARLDGSPELGLVA